MSVNFDLNNEKILFAHDVLVSSMIKAEQDLKSGEIIKEPYIELAFVDFITKRAVARVTLPSTVLEKIPKLIQDTISKINEELKDKKLPTQKIETKLANASYLG